jgi:hypothetical protein
MALIYEPESEQTIGAAGHTYGNGRVAALSKAINLENLSDINKDSFVRMFMNVCLWATRNAKNTGRGVYIFGNNNSEFDQKMVSLFNSTGYFSATLVAPWYSDESLSFNTTGTCLYVVCPSYGAFSGNRMNDDNQFGILNDVYVNGVGLVLCEWFHLLQSIPAKRSFSFTNPTFYDYQQVSWLLEGDGHLNGLIDASPFNIPHDYLIFTDADEIKYSLQYENDSISFAVPKLFSLDSNIIDTPFNAHITQLTSIKDSADIFWLTDLTSPLPPTTTTTTTPPPDGVKIKAKVFDLNLLNVCGPQKLYLEGQDKDKFELIGNELFLTQMLYFPTTLSIEVVAEDYFENERFNRVVEHLEINVLECNHPITLPKDGTYPAYSFRLNGGAVQKAWGQFAPTGVIKPFTDWEFYGRGTQEHPAIACLGGKHSDNNALWMQVNEGGEYSTKITTSFEEHYTFNSYSLSDYARLFLVTNTEENESLPQQHLEDIENWSSQPHVTELGLDSNIDIFDNVFYGSGVYNFSFNSENPNAVDDDGNVLTKDIFLILYLKKDMIRSEYDDRVCAEIVFGQTTTTPPPEFDYGVFINNKIDEDLTIVRVFPNQPDVEVTSFSYTAPEGDNPEDNVVTLRITLPGQFVFDTDKDIIIKASDIENALNLNFGQISISDFTLINNSDHITISIRSFTNNSITLDVTLINMPEFGGLSEILLDANFITTTTTTTTLPPRYPVTLIFSDLIDNASFQHYRASFYYPDGRWSGYILPECISDLHCTYQFPAGQAYVTFGYYTSQGYEYRPDQEPTGDFPGSQPPINELYTFYDRPTVTQIISQTSPNMVSLPSPKPNSGGDGNISVSRGSSGESSANSTYGYIFIPINVPPLGGVIRLQLGYGGPTDPNHPDVTTTTTTTAPPEPCDNSIYVICQQVLDCQEDSIGNCTPSSNSYQQLILSSCCNISQSAMLAAVVAAKNLPAGSTLADIYGSDCVPTNFELFAPCLPKQEDGSCQETIHNEVLDVILCPALDNPLP